MSNRFPMIICAVIALLLGFPFPAYSDEVNSATEGKLIRMVVLSRHGVRSPTQSAETLAGWSAQPWPHWPVQRGWLTERGARLTEAMWENMKLHLINSGVELEPELVFVRADLDQRTQSTARAILDGLGMGKTPYFVAQLPLDPLFHPVKSGALSFNAGAVHEDILRQSGGDLEQFAHAYSAELEKISELTGPLSPELCREWGLPSTCGLADLPNKIVANDKNVGLQGGLGIASSLAEIFVLEYGEWTDRLPAWGRADEAVLRSILPVHNRVFDLVNRAPAVAGPRGSALLREIEAALDGKHAERQVNQAGLVVFVGHDTNISNIGGLLDIHWQLPGHGDNAIPPAGALVFELRQLDARREVRVLMCAQSLETLHGWTAADPIDTAMPVCRPAENASGNPVEYSLSDFSRKVQEAVMPEDIPLYMKLISRERP